MMLNQCTKDFQSLIERLQLLRAYEDADETSRYVAQSTIHFSSFHIHLTYVRLENLEDST